MPIGLMCAIRGAILGTKRPKYNKTLRATATTPTTSTTIGLLSACSKLLTKLKTALLCPSRCTRIITQVEKPRSRSAVAAARTSQNYSSRDCLETPNGVRFVVPRGCTTG